MVTTVDPPVIRHGEQAQAEQVEVDMFMSADDGHRFWLGELNIPMAMARKKIRIQGPVGVLLKLLPALQPAFGMYRDFLTERGFDTPASA
jgi:putative sterol carrier protein